MPALPAQCARCGQAFLSAIYAENARGLTISEVGQDCPYCGGMGRVVNGTFDIGAGPSGMFTQTGGEPINADVFTRLGLVLIQAQLEGLKPEEVVRKVAPISSTWARRLTAVADDPQAFATVIAALIATFGAVTAAVMTTNSNSASPPAISRELKRSSSEGEMLRLKKQLYEMRERKSPLPSWMSGNV